LETERIAFTALRNRLNASGPSFISAVRCFMGSVYRKQKVALGLI
jgi:hypothetical protein